jgi:hypothetical protein
MSLDIIVAQPSLPLPSDGRQLHISFSSGVGDSDMLSGRA